MSYDNTNTGAIWPNKKRETEKHPTHTGTINVEGVEYYVSGWVGDKTKNQPSLSLKIRRKDEQVKPKVVEQKAPEVNDSDIPF